MKKLKAQKSGIKVLWITDPWSELDYPDDTALRLMEECAIQGHATYWSSPEYFEVTPGKLVIHARKLISTSNDRKTAEDYRFGELLSSSITNYKYIFYRVDPPVTESYLQPLRILTQFARGTQTEIINPPSVLGLSSEKFEGIVELQKFYAPMLISANVEALKNFGIKEKKTVAKLVHMAQSREVKLLDWDSPGNIAKSLQVLEEMTSKFKLPVVLQRFFPEVHQGETRLWFVDGKLLTPITKLPTQGEFVINLWQGGKIELNPLTAQEKKAALAIGKYLKKRKIRLAAVDLISGYITDFNYTSPALITEMERVLRRNLSKEIIKVLIK